MFLSVVFHFCILHSSPMLDRLIQIPIDPSNNVTGFPTTNPLSTIIIGTGSGTQPYPINRYWNYSSHEAIYLASQIGTACNITGDGALTLMLTGYVEKHHIQENGNLESPIL